MVKKNEAVKGLFYWPLLIVHKKILPADNPLFTGQIRPNTIRIHASQTQT